MIARNLFLAFSVFPHHPILNIKEETRITIYVMVIMIMITIIRTNYQNKGNDIKQE